MSSGDDGDIGCCCCCGGGDEKINGDPHRPPMPPPPAAHCIPHPHASSAACRPTQYHHYHLHPSHYTPYPHERINPSFFYPAHTDIITTTTTININICSTISSSPLIIIVSNFYHPSVSITRPTSGHTRAWQQHYITVDENYMTSPLHPTLLLLTILIITITFTHRSLFTQCEQHHLSFCLTEINHITPTACNVILHPPSHVPIYFSSA